MPSVFFSCAMNKEESFKCIQLSKKYAEKGNFEKAFYFVEKAKRLFSSGETEEWMSELTRLKDNYLSSSKASDPHHQHEEGPDRTKEKGTIHPNKDKIDQQASVSWTEEQLEIVKMFQKINKNDFYALLGIEKTATDIDIKKAYRKMALLYHPDKNKAPGADEAFKSVGRAFAILSNEEKRRQYDLYGEEISTENGGHGSTFGHSSFDELHKRHPEFFEVHIGADDIFNMFFSEFMSPVKARHFHFANQHHRSRRRQRQTDTNGPTSVFAQLLPVFLLLFLSFLNQLIFNFNGS